MYSASKNNPFDIERGSLGLCKTILLMLKPKFMRQQTAGGNVAYINGTEKERGPRKTKDPLLLKQLVKE